jgi:putative DNA modification/repair radical SAM protein
MSLSIPQKLAILADAAKYDVSCASSGATKRDSRGKAGLGSTTGMGICHSYTPDGRCVSLLKILLTNFCLYDCAYCINRRSSNVPRARFSAGEVVELMLAFYRRNYVEGLFLSSGIIQSADYTMEQLIAVAKSLREEHLFRGYIHLKTIPEASGVLIEEAGRYADRLSINIELPTDEGLRALAPEKRTTSIKKSMAALRLKVEESRERPTSSGKHARRFAPAGQSTQMIVGADGANDATILNSASSLYASYALKRVYYSAFLPIPDASRVLPLKPPPLQRENRLYQADWLMRFYDFGADEILDGGTAGMLELGIDPKLAWALKHRGWFPVDVNRAERGILLRVPGLGVKSVNRIIASRRHRTLTLDDVGRLAVSVKKLMPFLVTADHRPTRLADRSDLRPLVAPAAEQLGLFA